jgi:hypothetical protein
MRRTTMWRYEMRMVSKVLMVSVFALTALITKGAWATTNVYSPWGNGRVVNVQISHDPGDGGEWIYWQDVATGSCSFTPLGTGQINDNYVVHAPSAGSWMWIVNQTGTPTFCGYTQLPLRYGGAYLDLVGAEGADSLEGQGGNTFIWGQGGNDWLNDQFSGAQIYGGDGNDVIFATSAGALAWFEGGSGNDCLFINPEVSRDILLPRISCGPGIDRFASVFGGTTAPYDCETFGGACPN